MKGVARGSYLHKIVHSVFGDANNYYSFIIRFNQDTGNCCCRKHCLQEATNKIQI